MGNHQLFREGAFIPSRPLETVKLAHFPLRSAARFPEPRGMNTFFVSPDPVER